MCHNMAIEFIKIDITDDLRINFMKTVYGLFDNQPKFNFPVSFHFVCLTVCVCPHYFIHL